jgi:hypothetical protein
MKTLIFGTTPMLSFAALLWSPAQAANVPAWCPNSGYDNGPPRSRGPGSGIYWQGEPGDCRSIWRRGYYQGTDPDPFIRQQLMR